jgi:hypothetical protein
MHRLRRPHPQSHPLCEAAPPHDDDPLNQRHTSHPSRRSDSRTWVTGSRLHCFRYSFLVRDVPCLEAEEISHVCLTVSRRTERC